MRLAYHEARGHALGKDLVKQVLKHGGRIELAGAADGRVPGPITMGAHPGLAATGCRWVAHRLGAGLSGSRRVSGAGAVAAAARGCLFTRYRPPAAGTLELLAHRLGLLRLWPEPAVAATGPLRQWLLVPIVYVVAVVVTSLLRQLLQGMSRQRLRELLNGRYQQPEAENRIFLFIYLKDSTHLAETLGNDRYSRLVRDFFRDVSPAIAAARGEVY
jgi:hypothetical protein